MKKEFTFEKSPSEGAAACTKTRSGEAIKLALLISAICYHLAFLPGTLPLNGLTYLINFICGIITIYNIITRI